MTELNGKWLKSTADFYGITKGRDLVEQDVTDEADRCIECCKKELPSCFEQEKIDWEKVFSMLNLFCAVVSSNEGKDTDVSSMLREKFKAKFSQAVIQELANHKARAFLPICLHAGHEVLSADWINARNRWQQELREDAKTFFAMTDVDLDTAILKDQLKSLFTESFESELEKNLRELLKSSLEPKYERTLFDNAIKCKKELRDYILVMVEFLKKSTNDVFLQRQMQLQSRQLFDATSKA